MKGSEFVFDYAHLSYYKCYIINPNRGVSYIASTHWIKSNKHPYIPSIKKIINVFNTQSKL